jgi:hypothetical protein
MKKSELKQLIREEITKVLKESYDKTLVGDEHGEGGQHQILNYGKDKVIKSLHGGADIGYNLKIFTKYPEIFPKVYDMGKDYAILDKLDDKKSQNELEKIQFILLSRIDPRTKNRYISSNEPPENEYIGKLLQRVRKNGSVYYDGDITELIYNNLDDNELKSQLKKELPSNLYDSLIKNYYPLLQKVKNMPWDSKIKKDINDENFGYDINGNLKMLDI